jgi:outer membrane protein OmpA-like peptidoglycan-associated protein
MMTHAVSWLMAGAAALLMLSGCAQTPPAPQAASPTPPPPVQALPFDAAVLSAANTVFSTAPAAGGGQLVVIDPLVDGVTGEQSNATRAIQARIVALARAKYPQFDIAPFSPEAVNKAPFVMVGTFTPVNAQGQTSGDREAFRFCLVMADLRSGKTVAKGVARAKMDGVDATPIDFFRDSPAWTEDPSVKGYISTCQATKVGDPISPVYLNGILTASLISQAVEAYNAGRYREAADLYGSAQKMQAGDQLRVFNGLYLANWKLGRKEQAAEAFGSVVDYGLANNRLGVKLLFKPGSTAFLADGQLSGSYDMWLQQIATRSAQKGACLQVTGNTSRSGSAVLNDRLSLLRAEYVKGRLEADAPQLNGRVIANGVGSQANLIGTGADDPTDALDRRVEFKVISSC